ncbi:MAG: right-handed parallel beta-helix repeat-containing protein [Chloroflexota bacterium]
MTKKVHFFAFLFLLTASIVALPSNHVEAKPVANTIIVVDSTEDLADSSNFDNHTCSYTSGAIFFPAADGKCTLRRAILEAGVRPNADRPITIEFNIPDSDPNYDSNLDIWEVQIDESHVWELNRRFITDDGGQVTIDGNTQPNGRTNGPKIMVNTNRDNSAIFGRSLEVRTSNNTIKNLGFIGGGQIILYEGGNTIENNWMGLTADGTSISLASTATEQTMRSMARGGIIMPNEQSDNNVIQHNHIVGAFERAIRITSGGDNNRIENNFIGMNASGLVPVPPNSSVDCTRDVNYNANLWYGGRGMQVTGSNNTVINNRIAGLHVTQSTNETPPISLELSGNGHTVTGNIIGRDMSGNDVGVCGQGMLLQGTEHLVEGNTIVHSRNGFEPTDDGTDFDSAILTQSFATGSGRWITVRKNTVIDADQATHPDHVYRFASPGVPVELRQFNPAKVTTVNGTAVSGTRGDDAILPGGATISAACPNCHIYLYADDLDDRIEAYEFLGEAASDTNGDWTATLSRPLADNEGLRTQSMATGNGVIHNFGAGTTSKLSDDLYLPAQAPESVTIVGPTTGEIGGEYSFNITVNPADVALPIDYVITGDVNIQETFNSNQIALTVIWNSPGNKSFTVTASNGAGSPVMATHTIDIVDPSDGEFFVYLPMIIR